MIMLRFEAVRPGVSGSVEGIQLGRVLLLRRRYPLWLCIAHEAGGWQRLLWDGVYHWPSRIKVDFYYSLFQKFCHLDYKTL